MKRRTFLLFSLLSIVSNSFAKGKKLSEFKTLKSVLNHLFPDTEKYKGALSFNGFEFLMFISKHPSFDKNDLKFLIEGADEINYRYENFLNLSQNEKEKSLRDFETSRYGQNWLSYVMYYAIEAMLGDPIYKGNKDLMGWKNFNHTPPVPMAKSAFGEIS